MERALYGERQRSMDVDQAALLSIEKARDAKHVAMDGCEMATLVPEGSLVWHPGL